MSIDFGTGRSKFCGLKASQIEPTVSILIFNSEIRGEESRGDCEHDMQAAKPRVARSRNAHTLAFVAFFFAFSSKR